MRIDGAFDGSDLSDRPSGSGADLEKSHSWFIFNKKYEIIPIQKMKNMKLIKIFLFKNVIYSI